MKFTNTLNHPLYIVIFILLTGCASRQKVSYVPDKQTAVKIAEAIWLPIYGKDIYKETPFTATLNHGHWYVIGSKPDSALGGVAEIKIRKSDGKILFVQHLK